MRVHVCVRKIERAREGRAIDRSKILKNLI